MKRNKRRKLDAARRRELCGVAVEPRRPTIKDIRARVATMDDYAGLPCPVEEAPLVLAPKHPWHDRLNGVCLDKELDRSKWKAEEEKDKAEGLTCRNSWWCWHRRQTVFLIDNALTGKVEWGVHRQGPMQSLTAQIKTLGIAQSMDGQAELRAQKLLAQLLSDPAHGAASGDNRMNGYLLSGAFLETSKRSGVTYMFRRLATTIAMRVHDDGTSFLAALCLHPLAYYDGLSISTMVPTDDVIAHLVMMRADEHLFWRKANQHVSTSPGAQLG